MDGQGRRVTVMGLGAFGGGIGAVRYLVQQGAVVTVTDLKSADELADSIAQLADTPPAAWRLGQHHLADFENADLLVVSPAVPRSSPFVQRAIAARVPITTEMNLFWERNRGRVIGVTGTAGKSTTAALLHAILSADDSRRCWLGGNIGKSLLPDVHAIAPADWVVLELSSFQLDDLAPLQPNPEIAVVTNFAANHLDRHGSLDQYRAAKQNLLRWQSSDHVAICNADERELAAWPTGAERLGFGLHDRGEPGLFLRDADSHAVVFRRGGDERMLPLGEWLTLPGRHNLSNALAATCAALVAGASREEIEQGLKTFRALPHRLELVAEIAGRRFYNDSKATTPEAAMQALAAFDSPMVLLAGGSDKQADLAPFARAIVSRGVKAVALLGETGPRLGELLAAVDPQQHVARHIAADFPEAVRWAIERSAPGDNVLLSPGCASYDWFRNYEARGAEFTRLVRAWPGQLM